MNKSTQSQGDFVRVVNSCVEACVRGKFDPEVSTPALVYHARGGKALRTQLVHDFATGYGCELDKAYPIAAVTELFHTFALIHDDIEDSARSRRGGPSLHLQYGVPIAINAGDALFAASWGCLSEFASANKGKAAPLMRLFADTLARTISCQGKELAWVADKRWDVSWEDLREMIVGKTSWYSAVFPSLAIAELVSLPASERTKITDFTERLGLVYQLVDDLRPYTGLTDGKDVMSDLVEAKRTLVVILALALLPRSKKDRLRSTLDHGASLKIPDRLDSLLGLIRESGAIQAAVQVVKREGEQCLKSLHALQISPSVSQSLENRVMEMLAGLPRLEDNAVAVQVERASRVVPGTRFQIIPVSAR